MHEPHFWRAVDPKSRQAAPLTRMLLTPLAALYSWAGQRRIDKTVPFDPGAPVVCVGNLTLGGAGKTPVSAALRERFAAQGLRAATLSRGYKGKLTGPTRVDPNAHTATDVGDEPLMLAQTGESWIAQDRPAGARAMTADGVEVVILDDGHQNPTLKKARSIVVIDASEPFGNGHVFPKGPLREPVARGLARADAVVLMGDGETPAKVAASGLPVWRARLAPANALEPGGYVAFAGIGRPERFFDALRAREGVTLLDAAPFPDHHAYTGSDESYLRKLASERGARLVTTDKDAVRLSPEFRSEVVRASVRAEFDDPTALDALCSGLVTESAARD